MRTYIRYGLLAWLLSMPFLLGARPDVNKPLRRPGLRTSAEACLPSTSSAQLDVNNVRALLLNGGDMWWDLTSNPKYEIPKVDDPANARHSLFAGSLWLGGIDESNQLRIAAQTYRQSGNDFWPGPLRLGSATTEKEICSDWDKHYKINKFEIDDFRATATKTKPIEEWPAMNSRFSDGFERYLAPFKDVDGDQDYNPDKGDYPDILGDQAVWWVVNDKGNVHSSTNGQPIGIEIQMMAFGFNMSNAVNNMTFYKQKVINRSSFTLKDTYLGQWVDADLGYAFDDYVGCDTARGLGICYNGNAVDQPLAQGYGAKPPAIGVDFFQGPLKDANKEDDDKNGVVDDERIKMAKFVYYNNDFSLLGNPEQNVHYYNYLIGKWKNGASMIDDRKFNGNGFPDPGEAIETTNYMFPDYPGDNCSFTVKGPNPWDERHKGNPPGDRRFLQSAGPFTLTPGAVNEIIVGVVWARDQDNSYDSEQFGSFCALLQADDIAQALYDSNFDPLVGPDPPTVTIEELDQEVVISWAYTDITSNNYYENFAKVDPILLPAKADPEFTFQGYIVYQLRDDRVGANDLDDAEKARVVAQCDVKDHISTIVNREEIRVKGVPDPVIQDKIMVNGENKGIFRSVRVTQDKFADGSNSRLINYRSYFFAVVPYAYNDTASDGKKFLRGRFNEKLNFRHLGTPKKVEFRRNGTILGSSFGDGPDIQQIAGTGTGGSYLKFTPEVEPLLLNPANGYKAIPNYRAGGAPAKVKIYNPSKIKPRKYRLEIVKEKFLEDVREMIIKTVNGTQETTWVNKHKRYADWILYDVTGSQKEEVYVSEFIKRDTSRNPRPGANILTTPIPLSGIEKNIIRVVERDRNGVPTKTEDLGFSISLNNVANPGDTLSETNGFVGADLEFADPLKEWFVGLPDFDGFPPLDWIRSGPDCASKSGGCDKVKPEYKDRGSEAPLHKKYHIYDPKQVYEKILFGAWAPFVLASPYNISQDILGPGFNIWKDDRQVIKTALELDPAKLVTLDKLPNVDIVITSDPAKWSRCVVVETAPNKQLGSGAHVMTAKWRKSLSLQDAQAGSGKIEPPGSASEEYGMSYFPGYAVNVNTGERVNIFFGESTWLRDNHGDDMLFNPTVQEFDNLKYGGKHFLYVTNTKYDECKEIAKTLRVPLDAAIPPNNSSPIEFVTGGGNVSIAAAYEQVAWTSIPIINGEKNIYKKYADIPCDVRVELRVDRSFLPDSGCVYEFDFSKYAAKTGVTEVAKNSIDMINIVPNPFYGRSGLGRGTYEKNQLDHRTKITNLPEKCTIRIFTLNGTLVRIFRKDSENAEQEWDLKNDYGVPIASGLYVIYIDAGDLGEKILKFFAVMPALDMNAY